MHCRHPGGGARSPRSAPAESRPLRWPSRLAADRRHGAAMEPDALQKLRTELHVDLHPSKLGDVMMGVREQLNSQLLR